MLGKIDDTKFLFADDYPSALLHSWGDDFSRTYKSSAPVMMKTQDKNIKQMIFYQQFLIKKMKKRKEMKKVHMNHQINL